LGDAASFLGMREGELNKEIKKFNIDLTEMSYDNNIDSI
jgi:hypothetical protein